MPDINSGLALGELAGGIGRALQAKKQRQYAEEQKQHYPETKQLPLLQKQQMYTWRKLR